MKIYTYLGIFLLTFVLTLSSSFAGSGCCPGGGDKESKEDTSEKAE
jgi:hypothetical protein